MRAPDFWRDTEFTETAPVVLDGLWLALQSNICVHGFDCAALNLRRRGL
jgi:hypothetical protein